MPERLVVTIHAGAIGGLDRLLTQLLRVEAKLHQPAHPHASTHDGMVASGPVAPFATEALEVVTRFNLEELAHFGFGKIAREIGVAGVAIHAADVSWLGEVAKVDIVVAPSLPRPRLTGAHEATRDRDGDNAISFEHAPSLWQHPGQLAIACAPLTVRRVTEMLVARAERFGSLV